MNIREELDKNIPENEVTTRESYRGGPKLSYLTGAYVINRMNKTFGQGNWGYNIVNMTRVYEGEIEQSNGTAYTTSYTAIVKLWAKIGDATAQFDEVGYGDGTDKKSKGKAHELAVKEAITDAFKRGAKNLGISMGLGLYFKSGEYVDEEPTQAKPAKLEAPAKPKESAKPKLELSGDQLKEQIKNVFTVLQQQKKVTKEEFVTKFLEGKKTDDLDIIYAKQVLSKVSKAFPELKLNA